MAPAPSSTDGAAAAQEAAAGSATDVAALSSSGGGVGGGGGGSERRSRFRRICVYCGSAKGKKPSYQDAAIDLGNQLVISNHAQPSFTLLASSPTLRTSSTTLGFHFLFHGRGFALDTFHFSMSKKGGQVRQNPDLLADWSVPLPLSDFIATWGVHNLVVV
jgi:hypothetical protein